MLNPLCGRCHMLALNTLCIIKYLGLATELGQSQAHLDKLPTIEKF